MQSSFRGFCAAIALSAAGMVMSFSPNASAASKADARNQAATCDSNPNVDPSLRVCATKHESTTFYRIDTADGTYAELTISDDGVALQQSGPDVVRVHFASGSTGIDRKAVISQGISQTVYQDDLIAIDKLQSGSQPPAWVIFADGTHQAQLRVKNAICNKPDCGGGIVIN